MGSALMEKNEKVDDIPKYRGWNAMPFIIGNEVFEKLGIIGTMSNLLIYLTNVFNMESITAATIINIFSGTTNFGTFIAAFLCDGYFGRFKTLGFSIIACLLGSVVIQLTAAIPKLHPPHCGVDVGSICSAPTAGQIAFLLTGLGLLIIGAGGIRPCNLAFGADQFNPHTESGKRGIDSFFNWYFFTFTFAQIVSLTVVVYVQSSVSWTIGLGIPVALNLLGCFIYFSGSKIYVKVKATGSPLVSVVQVFAVSIKKRRLTPLEQPWMSLYNYIPPKFMNSKLAYTDQFRFLDQASIMTPQDELNTDGSPTDPWKLCDNSTKTMAPKRTPGKRAASAASREEQYRSLQQKKHMARCHGMALIKERGVDVANATIRQEIHTRGWGNFVADPGTANESLVREFYESMPLHETDIIKVRGQEVTVTADVVNAYFDTQSFEDEEDWAATSHYTTEYVLSTICKGTPQLQPLPPSVPVYIENKFLTGPAKVWYHLVSRRLLPNTAFHKVTLIRAQMICAIIKGSHLDIGKAMVKAIWSARWNTRSGLACPSLITALCMQHNVRVKSSDVMTPCEPMLNNRVLSTFERSAASLGPYRSNGDPRALVLISDAPPDDSADEDEGQTSHAAQQAPEPVSEPEPVAPTSPPPPESGSGPFDSSFDFSGLQTSLAALHEGMGRINSRVDELYDFSARRYDSIDQHLLSVSDRLGAVERQRTEDHEYVVQQFTEERGYNAHRWHEAGNYVATQYQHTRDYLVESNQEIFGRMGMPPNQWPQWGHPRYYQPPPPEPYQQPPEEQYQQQPTEQGYPHTTDQQYWMYPHQGPYDGAPPPQ